MTPEEKKKIIDTLLNEKAKLETKISDLKESTQPISPDCAIGRVSRMDAINNKSVNEAALRSAETKLRNIEISLEKSDDSEFGKCRQCGFDIPVGRLMVMPGSTRCVGCASR
ncbi:MAG: TraR/DksA C4-type zinc finger protein [Bacteroidales bacterium]|nr:TraR/DksA C4-type zinc finger protein [Bacteroidales bacterium]